jgi:hypothetical protein
VQKNDIVKIDTMQEGTMIIHVVTVKFKEPSQENLESAVEQIRALAGKIAVLQSIEAGTDIIRSERSYDLALVARFNNVEDLKIYATHPIHLPVLEFVRSHASDMTAVDFEV